MNKIEVTNLGKTDEYVYDINLDGTVVNALGFSVLSNTDGVNFKLPDTFEFTEDNPYISTGENRNTKEGEKYTGLDADVAQFNDLFMRGKNGLGIDEVLVSTVNLSRKNYLDYFHDGSVKLVGNSVKSKKMPPYIKKFLEKAIVMLLENRGSEFLDFYYSYIEKLYNRKIDITDIVSIGKIKTSLKTYIDSTNTFTKSGSKKARQAWYELAIKHNLNVNMGDTIYYVNTGTKKTESDVKRISVAYDENGNDITKKLTKEYNVYKKTLLSGKTLKFEEWCSARGQKIVDELIFNCELIDIENYNQEEQPINYNVSKYITQFNNRVEPLFVVFDKQLRDGLTDKGKYKNRLIITNPEERMYISEKDTVLTSNQPYNEADQDYYDVVMIPEDKEIEFWLSVNKKPPYIDECGLNWDNIVSDYTERKKKEEDETYRNTITDFKKKLFKLERDDLNDLILGGRIPKILSTTYKLDPKSKDIYHIETKYVVDNLYSIIDENQNPFDPNNIDELEPSFEENF